MNNAFTDNQRAQIISTFIEAADSNFDVDGGYNTNDFAFLMSAEKLEKYYSDYEDEYYWFRTPGEKNGYMACADPNGWVNLRESGELFSVVLAIRLTLWVDISNIE